MLGYERVEQMLLLFVRERSWIGRSQEDARLKIFKSIITPYVDLGT